MWSAEGSGAWSAAGFAAIENTLWHENRRAPVELAWLQQSWEDPARFGVALHTYWQRRQGSPSKSIPWARYDFYHDVLVRQKDQTAAALIWFENESWQTWSYAELGQAVNSLAATWEAVGVQPGETLAILYPQGPLWLMALLAGLRLGLVVTLLPPQGNSFVRRRLNNLEPQWLVMDQLYKHQIDAIWYEKVLPNTLSSVLPSRRSFEYPGTTAVVQCFDPTSATPDLLCPIDADSLYLNAIRDGIFALGIQVGQRCAAPGWHGLESQPAMILAVLMCGGAWIHINFSELKKQPERLLEQPIDVLGVSRSLRDLLQLNPLSTEKSWRYWFRHPSESDDFSLWQDFIEDWQLENSYSGNVLCNAARGGAILFSPRRRGQAHHQVLPAAGLSWQLGVVDAPDLPTVEGWGRLALGKKEEEEIVWTNTPYIVTPYLKIWNYLGQYPRGRAGRTYHQQEVLKLLADKVKYLALVEAFVHGTDNDSQYVLLAFGPNVDTAAIEASIEFELGNDFLPDRIEWLPLLPQRNEEGGADHDWCQFHYSTGELYRRQRSDIYRCLSELKGMILG